MTDDCGQGIRRLQGPILVLGASGFVGANLLRAILAQRDDAVGTARQLPAWRLDGLPASAVRAVDLLVDSNIDQLLDEIRPRTVFDCVAYGAYSFETDASLIYQTNFTLAAKMLDRLARRPIACYVHAGSSSEYGDHAAGPAETAPVEPNSDYSVSKISCANLLWYYGKRKRVPCANLRLYSVYGPLEDSSRLIPAVIRCGEAGTYPPFVDPDISRDFVYIDDVCDAFVRTAINLRDEDCGESYNIGSSVCTTIGEVALIAREFFDIPEAPVFSMPNRSWDVTNWFASIDKAASRLDWRPTTEFRDGLARTADWFRSLKNKDAYLQSSKRNALDTKHSVSAVIACYRDNQAIPIMYERLTSVFRKLAVDYEIIFVNDNSPDDSEEVIRGISRNDRRVLGISHSRNFGSQSAFRSGMEVATKNSCVLLDGDLQDPPEMIEAFVAKWREGHDVVYGRRTKRVAPIHMRMAYKLFYRLFDAFSYLSIPHDAGDFALMDRRVVAAMLQFPERDMFLRGMRAFVGFRQTGVDYVRPERMFGRTTNNVGRNLGWAKKGILSFSNTPLSILSYFGSILLITSTLLIVFQVLSRLLFPQLTPKGVTTMWLSILFFGSVNLFALGLIGEYIATIFEEVKRRPQFVRRSIIRDGKVRDAADMSARRTE